MATKPNIRSIRFSDELAELIDRQTRSSARAPGHILPPSGRQYMPRGSLRETPRFTASAARVASPGFPLRWRSTIF